MNTNASILDALSLVCIYAGAAKAISPLRHGVSESLLAISQALLQGYFQV